MTNSKSEKFLLPPTDGSLHTQSEYHVIPKADFPGMHDYYCTDSHSPDSCELAVFSLQEAKYQCNVDPHCKAFVVTPSKTWIGKPGNGLIKMNKLGYYCLGLSGSSKSHLDVKHKIIF